MWYHTRILGDFWIFELSFTGPYQSQNVCVYLFFGQNIKFRTAIKWKINSKFPAHSSCISLKSTNINKFGLIWLAVFISVSQIWSTFFSNLLNLCWISPFFLQKAIFLIFHGTASMSVLIKQQLDKKTYDPIMERTEMGL